MQLEMWEVGMIGTRVLGNRFRLCGDSGVAISIILVSLYSCREYLLLLLLLLLLMQLLVVL